MPITPLDDRSFLFGSRSPEHGGELWTYALDAPNAAPAVDVGGPYAVGEGAPLMLDASASGDADGNALAYSWDVNGEGVFDDAVGVAPTLSWAQLVALGITDGPLAFANLRVRVSDGRGGSADSATVRLDVANVSPSAGGDAVGTPEDAAASFDVLHNDLDPGAAGAPLSLAGFTQPANGSVALNPDGTFTYMPAAEFSGADAFTYTVADDDGGSAVGRVDIVVRPVNDAPSFTAGPDEDVAEDSGRRAVVGWAAGIIAGPPNEAGQALAFDVITDNPRVVRRAANDRRRRAADLSGRGGRVRHGNGHRGTTR